MDFTVFTGAGEPLGTALLGMLAASLAGAAAGAWAPWSAYRRLREEDSAFDAGGRLRGMALIFQAEAVTGLLYGLVAAFFLAMLCGALSGAQQLPAEIAAAVPRLTAVLAGMGGANLIGGVGKGVLAARQLGRIAREPQRFGYAVVFTLVPEALMILALLLYMLTAVGL